MDKKEAMTILKAYVDVLKYEGKLPTNGKVMKALGFAMAVLEADTSEYEYAMFSWDQEKGKYEQIGRPMQSELLARNRFEESVKNGWFNKRYDISRAVMKRRLITMHVSEWEECLKQDENEN